MKYEKVQNILPEDVIELIQEYIDGRYLYNLKSPYYYRNIYKLGYYIFKCYDFNMKN